MWTHREIIVVAVITPLHVTQVGAQLIVDYTSHKKNIYRKKKNDILLLNIVIVNIVEYIGQR